MSEESKPADRLIQLIDEFHAEGISSSALSEWLGLHRTQLQRVKQRMSKGQSCTVDTWIHIAKRIQPSLEWWIYGTGSKGYNAAKLAPTIHKWHCQQLEQAKQKRRKTGIAIKMKVVAWADAIGTRKAQ